MLQAGVLKRNGGWLALFALWLQLAVSFGHLHPEEVFGPAGRLIVPGHGATEIAAPRHDSPLTPVPAGESEAADVCAICAVMAMAATSVPPVATSLPAPSFIFIRHAAAHPVFRIAARPFLLFRTRAPPLHEIA
jgi:hypothetical protein